MFQRIVNRRTRIDPANGRSYTTYHTEQGFGYELVDQQTFEVKLHNGENFISQSAFVVRQGMGTTYTVIKRVLGGPPGPRPQYKFSVQKTQNTYTMIPETSARPQSSVRYVVSYGMFGYKVSIFSDDDFEDRSLSQLSAIYAEAMHAFDVGIFLSELQVEREWNALPPGRGILFSNYRNISTAAVVLPPDVEASITEREVDNAALDTV